MSDKTEANEVSYGFGVKVAVLMLIIVQYTMTITTQVNTSIMGYSLSLGEQFGYLYNQTDAIVYSLALVSGLSTTFLLRVMSKKQVALLGTAFMAVFGFLPFFTGETGYLGTLIPRAFVGLGVGIVFPFAASYAVDLFKGGKESWMLGMRSVTGACAGYFFMNASVVINNNYYNNPAAVDAPVVFPAGVFFLPLVAVLCFIVMFIKLPDEGKVYATENLAEDEKVKEKPYASTLIYTTIAVLMVGVVLAIAYFVYNAASNNPAAGITPDPGIANPMSYAIAVAFLLFAVLFVVSLIKIAGYKDAHETIATKIKSNTWVYVLANVLIIGAGNCMMANVAQVAGGPIIAGIDLANPANLEVIGDPFAFTSLTIWNFLPDGTPVPTVQIPTVMNFFTIAMLVSGFIFKPVWVNIFKRHAYTMGVTMIGVGLVLLFIAVAVMGNLVFAVVAAIIFGLGFQTYNGAVILRLAQTNDNKHVALGVSYLMAFNGVGQTFGPIWIPGLIMIITGVSFDNFLLFQRSWLAGGIVCLVMAVIMGIFIAREHIYRPEATM